MFVQDLAQWDLDHKCTLQWGHSAFCSVWETSETRLAPASNAAPGVGGCTGDFAGSRERRAGAGSGPLGFRIIEAG